MPELVEVEVARRRLMEWTADRPVASLSIHDEKRITGEWRRMEGARVVRWERRGKLLLGHLQSSFVLLSHLGMTGKWVADPPPERAHQRLVLRFSGTGPDTVAFLDTRRFGFCRLVPSDALAADKAVATLGPDAWDHSWTGEALQAVVGHRRVAWKQALMEQSRIAGLGNIAVCEMGWRAEVHPHRSCVSLTAEEWNRLVTAMRAHLDYLLREEDVDEIRYLSEGPGPNPFLCYGRAGQHCSRCNERVERAVLAGRPTFWCPGCQPIETGMGCV